VVEVKFYRIIFEMRMFSEIQFAGSLGFFGKLELKLFLRSPQKQFCLNKKKDLLFLPISFYLFPFVVSSAFPTLGKATQKMKELKSVEMNLLERML
jgi:hypothetical protein